MQIIDNINTTVKGDLQSVIHTGSNLSIAAACFSIYAYQELKKQLEGIDELRFIFTSPTFVTERTPKAQREFYIPRISRERSLYGTEFEVKLSNELTQKAIAKECADWIRRKVTFKSNVTGEQMMGFMTVDQSTYIWVPEDELRFRVDGLNMDAVYESLVRQIAGGALQADSGESLQASVERDETRRQLEKQIAALERKMRKEKQLNRRMEINAELKRLRKEISVIS